MDFKSQWSKKEPINGINCFFTEDSFNKYSRLPSTLEERLLMKIKQIKGEPVCPSTVQVQSHTSSPRDETPVLGESVQILSDSTTELPTVQRETKTRSTPNQQKTKRKLGAEPPYVKKVPPPRKSRFSHDQQKRFVYLYKKYAHRASVDTVEEERSEIRELQILTNEVLEEQKEFQEFQEVLANTSHKTDYTYMHPATRAYTEDYIQSRKKEVELYPKYYNAETSFKIDGEGQSSKMVYIKPLLQLGIVPKMILPSVAQQLKPELPLDSPAISQQYPVSKNRNHKPGAWNHEPCSMDDNAAHLAVGNRAHIVISSGALQCLVDNHAPKHLEDWEMPVTVRDYPLKEGDKVIVHRVVFIDRPFLKPQLTSKDKNTKFFKCALKAFIAKPSQKGHVFSKIENSQTDTKPVGPTPADNAQSSTIPTSKALIENVGKGRTVTKEEPFSTEDVSLEDLECFGTAKKNQNFLSKNKQTSAVEVKMESQSSIEDLESFGTVTARKPAGKAKPKDSDQDLLRKIKEMHKPQKQTLPIKTRPIEKTALEIKDVEMNSLGNSSTCEFQGKYTDTNSHGGDDSVANLKGQVACATDTVDVPDEEHFHPDVIENTGMDSLNEISQTSTLNIINDVTNKSGTQMIPWRTPELLNECEEKTTPRKAVKIPARRALGKSEDDSSDEDEDKLYIMESPKKKMEVIDEAPASPSPASPDPGTDEMEICRIIPIGSDYASDSAQSPARLQESPTSPCKESSTDFSEALPCPIIPLCRESEDETADTSKQGQTPQQNIQLPVASFEKPVSTSLRRSNRHKNENQRMDSLKTDSGQCERKTSTLDNSFRESCGLEDHQMVDGDSDEELVIRRKKSKRDVITSDSEDEGKEVKAEAVKKKRGRPRKNPIVVSVAPKENESTEKKPGASIRMVTRSRSSVGGTSEEEVSDKEVTNRSRRKCKSGITTTKENNVEVGKSAEDGNEVVKDQEIVTNQQSFSSDTSEASFVQAKRLRSDSAENLLGKIGPQKRVSRIGRPPIRPPVPISKLESSKSIQPEAKSREKSSRQTDKLQDKFSLDSILNVQQKLHKSSGEPNVPNYASENVDHIFKFPQRNNVTYNLWDLGGFSVIVRCNIHGVIRDINQQLSFIHLVPKLEYQCLFGMEQVTPSETARTWISSYIRPNCRVLRARFHTQRTELVCLEELQPAQIVPPTQGFSPGSAFLMLQNIFHHLHQLSPGQYLLGHKKFSDKCMIKKATEDNKRGSYDLHFNQLGFADPEFDLKKVPWTPLDPTIMLPYHTLHGRIPLTFDPIDFKFNYSSQSKIAKRKKKNKGKRNKGKNKPPQQK